MAKLTSVMTVGAYQMQRTMVRYVATKQGKKRTAAGAYGAILTYDRGKAGMLNSMYTSGFPIE